MPRCTLPMGYVLDDIVINERNMFFSWFQNLDGVLLSFGEGRFKITQ